MMKKRFGTILGAGPWAAMVAAAALLLSAQVAVAAPVKTRLLVLHSYHQDLPWSRGLMQGINAVLDKAGMDVELHVEYLDAIGYRRETVFPLMESVLAGKYRIAPPSVVMTTDDIALDFVLARRGKLFPGIPLVFCAPNNFTLHRIRGHKQVTGVAEAPDFQGTLDLAFALHPKAGTVALVSDRSPAALRRLSQLEPVKAGFRHRAEFRLLTDAGLTELETELGALPPNSIVLFLNFLRDRTGKQYPSGIRVLKGLSQKIPLPFYTYKKIDIGHGAVGGQVISETLMAEHATAMAVQILKGKGADDIPIVYRTPTVAMFDHRLLGPFGLTPRQLPEARVLVNAPRSFYQIHKIRVWSAGAAGFVMALLISVLSVNVIGRIRAERALRKARERLEHRVAQRTAELVRANDDLMREIAERKGAEEALRASRERYRALSDATFEAIFISENGICTETNQRAAAMFGYRYDELIGIFGTDVIADESKEAVRRHMLDGYDKPYEVLAQRKDGSIFHAELCGKMTRYMGKEVRTTVVRDIEARKKAEKERKRLEVRLRHAHKMEAVGTLAGGIAHDFNNLLMAIAGNASLLRYGLDKGDPAAAPLEAIENSVRSGAHLTRQLLGYARKGNYRVAPLDLNRLISEMARAFGRTHRGVEIDLSLSRKLPAVNVDRSQMEQILLNLWANAADAMAHRGRLTVQTGVVAGNGLPATTDGKLVDRCVRLTVADNGLGMDDATRKRIFEPFFTTKEMGRGTGLGLASVYGIVKTCHGRIDVESKPGQGTRFHIYFPPGPALPLPKAAPPEPAVRGKGTILLVDDEALVADVGTRMLERLGYRVLTAGDGRTAIRRFKAHEKEVDLVILDMIMPKMGGSETYEGLRRLCQEVKVLISSGYSQSGDADALIEKGCCGFIQKPYDLKTLGRKIKEAMAA